MGVHVQLAPLVIVRLRDVDAAIQDMIDGVNDRVEEEYRAPLDARYTARSHEKLGGLLCVGHERRKMVS